MGFRVGGLLFSQVKKSLGENLRYFASGGAALDPRIARDCAFWESRWSRGTD